MLVLIGVLIFLKNKQPHKLVLELTKYQIKQEDYDMNETYFLFMILFLKPVTKLFSVALIVRLALVFVSLNSDI